MIMAHIMENIDISSIFSYLCAPISPNDDWCGSIWFLLQSLGWLPPLPKRHTAPTKLTAQFECWSTLQGPFQLMHYFKRNPDPSKLPHT